MQLQAELRESFTEGGEEPLCVSLMLEPGHEVVSLCRDRHKLGIFTESKGTYGSPRVHRVLRKAGTECGKRRVRRLMRQAGLEGRCKKRWRKTTVADPAAEAARDLIQRHFGVCEEVDRRYVGGIHLHRHLGGVGLPGHRHRPLVASSRRVGLADHMRTELVSDAITMAFANRSPERGLIFHSDRGCLSSTPVPTTARMPWRSHHQKRAHRHPSMANACRSAPCRLRLHRGLVQHTHRHSSLDYCSPAEWESIHRNVNLQAA